MRKAFLAIFAVLITGCTGKKNIPECKNTFVVSGDGYRVSFFEHDTNNVSFHLIGEYLEGTDAFYSCNEQSLVMFQENEKEEGIKVVDIKTGKQKLYETNEGFNGVIARKDNWFLYSTSLMKKNKLNLKLTGHIPKYKIFNNSEKNNNKKYVDSNSKYYAFTEDKMFSLNEHKVIKTYPFGMWPISELVGHTLYVYIGDYVKINIETGKAEKLWIQSNDNNTSINYKDHILPKQDVELFVNGVLYIITSSQSYGVHDNENNEIAVKFERGAIYKLENGKLSHVTKLPFNDIVYANSPDKKYLYIFTKSRKVIKFNIDDNLIDKTYDINIDLNSTYELGTVGFTNENFILTFEDDEYMDGYIVVTDRNFSRYSKPYRLDIGGIDVSTEKSIHTNSYRKVNL